MRGASGRWWGRRQDSTRGRGLALHAAAQATDQGDPLRELSLLTHQREADLILVRLEVGGPGLDLQPLCRPDERLPEHDALHLARRGRLRGQPARRGEGLARPGVGKLCVSRRQDQEETAALWARLRFLSFVLNTHGFEVKAGKESRVREKEEGEGVTEWCAVETAKRWTANAFGE